LIPGAACDPASINGIDRLCLASGAAKDLQANEVKFVAPDLRDPPRRPGFPSVDLVSDITI